MRLTVLLAAILLTGCEQFSNRVLIRAANPTRALVFVCQEIPQLDGPGHDWRLETPDGMVVRELGRGSDGNGRCDAAVWSDDGAMLAIVERGTITIADVAWALAHPDEPKTHWFVRQFSYSTNAPAVVRNVRFTAPGDLTFEVSGRPTRMTIPSPLVPGRTT
jgi:hypothetical protein